MASLQKGSDNSTPELEEVNTSATQVSHLRCTATSSLTDGPAAAQMSSSISRDEFYLPLLLLAPQHWARKPQLLPEWPRRSEDLSVSRVPKSLHVPPPFLMAPLTPPRGRLRFVGSQHPVPPAAGVPPSN